MGKAAANKQKYTRIWAKQPQQGKMEGQFSHILLGIIGQISHRIVGSLCVEAEIVVYSSCHLKPSVITEVQHVPLLLFAPMFPPMNLVLGHGYVAVLVHLLDGVGANTISMESRVIGNIVLDVQSVNCLVQPVNFFHLILIARERITSVIRKPG